MPYINSDTIPGTLKEFPQWVCWRNETRQGKSTKVPKNPRTGKNAKSNDFTTWGTFDEALDMCIRKKYDGLGFMLDYGTVPLVGIDLDDCLIDGLLTEDARSIVLKLNSYTEITPSSRGIRIFVLGDLPPQGRKKGKQEMYKAGRFLTVTGHHLPGSPTTIEKRTHEILAVHRMIFGEAGETTQISDPGDQLSAPSDSEILKIAKNAKNGTRFEALWKGDVDGYKSQSEAELALCNLLAFYTGRNSAAIDRLFRQSGLYRDKWDRKTGGTTYGALTIQKAIAGTHVIYTNANYDFVPELVNAEIGSNNKRQQEKVSFVVSHPALPFDVDADYQNDFLTQYLDYARSVSPMTPVGFHQSAGLWLVGVAIARRLRVDMSFGAIFPNLYILWIAMTTLFRKSTGMNIARKIALQNLPHLLGPQDVTPEALVADLAGRMPTNFNDFSQEDQAAWRQSRNFSAQKGWILDEFSSLIGTAGKKYNAGLIEITMRLYDCDTYFRRSTLTHGTTIVKNAFLSILGASTPAAMAPYFKSEKLWAMGFWPRFALLTPETEPEWSSPSQNALPESLTGKLSELSGRLPTSEWPEPAASLSVTLGKGVNELWQKYAKAVSYDLLIGEPDSPLSGIYGRLPTQAMKIATILAALDWSNKSAPVIQNFHMTQAISIAEEWRASAHRVLIIAADNDFNIFTQRVLGAISRFGTDGATKREIIRAMGGKIRVNVLDPALEELRELQEIEAIPGKGTRSRFRVIA